MTLACLKKRSCRLLDYLVDAFRPFGFTEEECDLPCPEATNQERLIAVFGFICGFLSLYAIIGAVVAIAAGDRTAKTIFIAGACIFAVGVFYASSRIRR